MSTAPPSSGIGSLEDLREAFQRVQLQLASVQKELQDTTAATAGQAQKDKAALQTQLDLNQKIWDQQDAEWHKARDASKQKLTDLERWFTKQLSATEQNALRALNDLDSAWQRDKLQWHQSLAQREKDVREREEALRVQVRQQTDQLERLQAEKIDLQGKLAQAQSKQQEHEQQVEAYTASLETEISNWKRDRVREQTALAQGLQDLDQRQAALADERLRYLSSLENQIFALHHLVKRLLAPRGTPVRAAH